MKTFRMLRLSALTAVLVVLTGCATQQAMNRQSLDRYQSANNAVDATVAAHPTPTTPVAPIDSDVPYVNVVPVAHSSDLPAVFNQSASLNTPAGPAWQTLQTLQQVIGMPINADDDVLDGTHGTTASVPSTAGSDATLAPPPSVSAGGDGGARRQAQLPAIERQDITKALLNYVAGQLDATWKYDAQTHSIHIFRFENRLFHIETSPDDSNFDASVDTSSGQEIQGGQGQAVTVSQDPGKTEFKGMLSIWKALSDNIKPMLSAQGTLQVNESLAAVTVRDRWERVDAIAQYIDQVNRSLGMGVEVNVKIFRVQQNDSDNRGISWGVLYNTVGQAATSLGASITTPQPTASGLASLILDAPTKNGSGGTSLFNGSQFFINALSSLGKVSAIQNATIQTTNNVPQAFERIHSVAYVASTTPVVTTGNSSGSSIVGAGATIQPGEVVTGFDMQALPSVAPDGHRLLLQMKITVSTLDSMGTFTTGGNTVQQPNVSKAGFINRTWLSSGQVLILAGFEDTETNNTTNSVLDKSLWGLGGNRALTNTKDEFVVVITPVVTQAETTLNSDPALSRNDTSANY